MTSIASEAFSTMERHLAEATVDLFDGYGIAVRPVELKRNSTPAPDPHSLMAVIGYVGDKVRGGLVLLASTATVESWLPAIGMGDGATDLCDTLGEFSNMLLGRLKARLLPEGFPILLSTPTTTASGDRMRISAPPRPSTLLTFEGPGWRLTVRIDATFEEGFALQAQDERQAAADAGEMMFF